MEITQKELSYWIAFDRLKGLGLGSKRIYELYNHFNSLEIAWHADKTDLLKTSSIPQQSIEDFLKIRNSINTEIEIERLEKYNAKAFPRGSKYYPTICEALKNPPLLLYVRGNWDLSWYEKSIAIVGTREATSYAMEMTAKISRELASQGFTIITGIARGIDTAAHKGAFLEDKNRSVAVMASGVDEIVPKSNQSIYDLLIKKGSVISEYPIGTKPEKGYFPLRNRIIAALSQAVLVSEAKEKSGALITAEYALGLNRRVFCLGGNANNPQNTGCYKWIRKGMATLITSSADIIEEMEMKQESKIIVDNNQLKLKFVEKPQTSASPIAPTSVSNLNETERKIYEEILGRQSLRIDDLIDITGLPIAKINSAIMTLNLKKLVKRNTKGELILNN